MHKCQRNMISQGTITKVWDLRLCRNKPYNKSPKTSWKVSLLYCACPFSFLVYNQEPYNPTFLAVISLLSFFISFFFLLLCITFQNNPVTWSNHKLHHLLFSFFLIFCSHHSTSTCSVYLQDVLVYVLVKILTGCCILSWKVLLTVMKNKKNVSYWKAARTFKAVTIYTTTHH